MKNLKQLLNRAKEWFARKWMEPCTEQEAVFLVALISVLVLIGVMKHLL